MAVLLLLFLYHLLLLIPYLATSKCLESIQCGDRFSLEFPFTDKKNPACGLFMVDGCDYGTPIFHFGNSQYNMLEKISTNKFKVINTFLGGHLSERRCFPFINVSLPISPSVSFTISSNLTLFTCNNRTSNEDIEDHFSNYSRFYSSQEYCGFPSPSVYYLYPTTDVSAAEENNNIPTDCGVIQLPLDRKKGNSSKLLDLLTAEFDLEWNVFKDCYECYHGGGQCLLNSRNQFHCKKGNNKRLILAITLPIAAIVIFLVTGYILWQRKKKTGGMAALTSTLMILFFFIWRKRAKARQKYEADIELFLKKNGNHAPMRYRYSSIKKMTNSFSVNLGKGGYGSVYKGKFTDGHLVAVKLLNESNGNGEEFMNEVASISRTSHINIVSLLGFCFEGPKRALIYDFMPNGSLEKFIGNTASAPAESELGWDKLFEIALGIARGLEYLHQGCNMRILHLDIKPQNILLDKDFNPRISDFGLAKLCPNRSSIVSMMVARGTIGYIAPEVFSRNFGDVSYKSDVYSYGMLVLEMVGGRKNIDPRDIDHTSEIYFPHYIYKQLEMDAERDLAGTVVEDEFHLLKKNLIIVGLWCIQTNPKDRPSMTKVVEMLEGKHGSLEVPPKPYLYSPPRLPPISISISDSM